MNRRVTLKEIARASGVHISTVSRALDPNGRTSLTAEVVQRIRETAERMGYRPNRLAAGLRTQRTMTVGLMIPDITNTLFPPMVRGVEMVLEAAGYALFIVNTDGDVEREAKLVDVLLDRGVDGIIDAAVYRDDPRMRKVAAEGIPLVTINRSIENSGIPAVVNDDEGGVAAILRLLHGLGHRQIAHVAGPANLSTGARRRRAFIDSATAIGLDLPENAIVTAKRFDEAEGRRCAEKLLDSGWPLTAVLAANDRLALGVLDTLRSRGISCPEEISVTGFNDMPLLDRVPPGLTTARVSHYEVGRCGAEILVKMMTDDQAAIPSSTVFPVILVERGSVAPPRQK